MKLKRKKVLNYSAVFEEDPTGGYAVWVPELPGCASQGETLDEAKKHIEEAIKLYLEDVPLSEIKETQSPGKQFIIPIDVTLPAHGQTL